ncbi:CGGC domain-containing protein [bacterium]|nr:CGGC domain-containing protein [bacterium]
MNHLSRRKFCQNILVASTFAGTFSLLGKKEGEAKPNSEASNPHLSNKKLIKLGIIICDRWHTCAGGKCLRSLRRREGAFSRYKNQNVELVGFTTCGGCPGGNIEYAPDEMKKNGADIIHLATGFVVGYPPCPSIEYFSRFIPEKYGLEVVVGTHPIPQKYYLTHQKLHTWDKPEWKEFLQPTLCDKETRLKYD